MINGLVSDNINGVVASTVNGIGINSISATNIIFTHYGQSFNPLVVLRETADVLWTFPDGSTSTELSPVEPAGVTESRSTSLVVTPWSALQRINLGYARADGGSYSIETHPAQQVTGILGLELVKAYLGQFCACETEIPALDFRGFAMLDTVEMYSVPALISLDVRDCPELERLCFENCRVGHVMDLSTTPKIGDIRGAVNGTYDGFDFGVDGGQLLWHLCCHTNNFPTYQIPWQQFPLLREIYTMLNNQSGAITMATSTLSYANMENNAYTSADFTGAFSLNSGGHFIDIFNCNLTELIIDNCPFLYTLNAQNNNLGETALNYILQSLDDQGANGGSLNISGNAGLHSNTTAYDSLIAKGWTVTAD